MTILLIRAVTCMTDKSEHENSNSKFSCWEESDSQAKYEYHREEGRCLTWLLTAFAQWLLMLDDLCPEIEKVV